MAAIYSFSSTGKNYSKLPPDQVIEMTMNKQSKNRRTGGWVEFSKNLSMIAISILSRPFVLYIRQQLQETICLKKPLYRHPELGPSRLKKDVEVTSSVKVALEEWDADPWDLTRPILCTGQPATTGVLNSLRTDHEDGNSMSETFATKTVPNKPKQQLRKSVNHAGTKQVVDLLTTGQNSTMTLED
ncbi:unnamed protein product [Ceutorhynchus assimilis]|uniref:Uncharacterized protein n=1 Tax=Ceutorhynchus assimilis TaxID=467358 RepID=A0A9N9MSC8_9CUCU|nr:unnamed protein product [Ceutorhynchus assimilis]